MTQTRAEKTAYMRQWSQEKMKDPDARAKKAAYLREWNTKNKEHKKTKAKEWYLANRSEILADMKAFRKAHPELRVEIGAKRRIYRRAYHLRTRYNTTVEHIESLLNQQNSDCAICHVPFPPTTSPAAFWHVDFHIDHCHTTGAVRGLLCFSCNQGIGSFKDSRANALAAAEYLR